MLRLLASLGLVWALLAPAAQAADPVTHVVAGRVLDAATGAPIEGARVSAQLEGHDEYLCKSGVSPPAGHDCQGNAIPFAEPVEVGTDGDGRFVFPAVPAHRLFLRAEKQGYRQPERQPDVVLGRDSADLNVTGDVTDVTLELAVIPHPAKTRLFGTVRDETGAPVAGALIHYVGVRVTPSHRPPFAERGDKQAQTGDDGSYSFGDVGPGPFYLIANHPDGPDARDRGPPATRDAAGNRIDYTPLRYPAATADDPRPVSSLARGEARRADLQFPGRSVLHHVIGKGVERDAPAPGAPSCFAVYISDPDGVASYRFHAFTPAESGIGPLDKRFEAWLPDGLYRIGVSCQACAMGKPCERYAGAQSLRVAGADVKDLAVAFGSERSAVEIPITISRAFACERGEPGCSRPLLYGLRLYPVDAGPFESPLIDVPVHAFDLRADGDADQTLKAVVPPGTYGVDIDAQDFAVKSVTAGTVDLGREYLTVEPGAPQVLRIVLDRGIRLEGRVLKSGQPSAGQVYVIPRSPKLEPYTPPRPEQSKGDFHLGGYAPGDYYVFATDHPTGLDFRDPATLERFVAQSSAQIKEITLEPGETPSLDLDLIEVPESTGE